MKKILLAVLLVAILLLSACVSALGASADGITAEEYASMTPEELLAKLDFANPEDLTAEEYIRLADTYRFVEIDYQKLVLTNTWSITDQVRENLVKFSAADHPEYMPMLMGSEYPQVRAVGYEQVFGVLGADADDLDAAVNALAAETDPYCLYVAVKGVGNEMRTRKEIADFISSRMIDHYGTHNDSGKRVHKEDFPAVMREAVTKPEPEGIGWETSYDKITLWMPYSMFPSEDTQLMEILYYDELQEYLTETYAEVW